MKNLLCIASLFAFTLAYAQQTPQAAIEQFFKAFHQRDTLALGNLLSDQIVFHTASEIDGAAVLSIYDRNNFLQSVMSIPADLNFEERILSWIVNTDGLLASIWTPYEFYVDDGFSHRGVNSFQLFKDHEIWKIVHCIDTRKR